MDLFIWFQIIYMSSSLFNTRALEGGLRITPTGGGGGGGIDLSSYES